MDAIKHANAFGTSQHGGVLAVAGDDHACKSSTLPHQSEHMFIGASVPVLASFQRPGGSGPGDFRLGTVPFFRLLGGLKAITENMDSAISADIDPDRVRIVLPTACELPPGGCARAGRTNPWTRSGGLNKYKIYAAREFARVNKLNPIVIDSPNPRLGIITSGKAYLDVMQALEDMGIDEAAAAEIGIASIIRWACPGPGAPADPPLRRGPGGDPGR